MAFANENDNENEKSLEVWGCHFTVGEVRFWVKSIRMEEKR